VSWSIQYTTHEIRAGYIDSFSRRLRDIDKETPMPLHLLDEFGADWRLKPGIAPRTIGHRRLEREVK
jgi:NAD(P)H dehydrogenase (quinone)